MDDNLENAWCNTQLSTFDSSYFYHGSYWLGRSISFCSRRLSYVLVCIRHMNIVLTFSRCSYYIGLHWMSVPMYANRRRRSVTHSIAVRWIPFQFEIFYLESSSYLYKQRSVLVNSTSMTTSFADIFNLPSAWWWKWLFYRLCLLISMELANAFNKIAKFIWKCHRSDFN